ncbi:hypothetical protein RJ40_01820 [Methanofollis aquaemaris]|uniref:Uncharacterized protein n=1 Tax=Methanofollis aquaemaris TaxID=126734 RepID=A0A8A3S2A2_9EURY|nr:hypothetical protein [Methanofollis aquaemaris]QSZ66325.1 hypothetical protein RJ40_01820 [Methanofollis aquaemaris]
MEKKIGSHSKWMLLLLIIAVAVTIQPVSATTHVVELGNAWIWDRPSVTSGVLNLCQPEEYTIEINSGDIVEYRMEYAFTDERTHSGDNSASFILRCNGVDADRDEIIDRSNIDDGEHRYLSWSQRYYNNNHHILVDLVAAYNGDRSWSDNKQMLVHINVV